MGIKKHTNAVLEANSYLMVIMRLQRDTVNKLLKVVTKTEQPFSNA